MSTTIVNLPATETISWERRDDVLTVRFNRPDRLNALSKALQTEMAAFWAVVAKEPTLRCVILTGNGRAFSAGADTSDLAGAVRPDRTIGTDALNFCPARSLEIPVIVAINGMCVGGALNFLADADIAIAADGAFFTDPHVTMGQVSGVEVLQLAAKASFTAVSTLALSGSKYRMSAQEAHRVGLVSEVLPLEELLPRAHEIADMICAQSPTAIRKTLRILRGQWREPTAPQLERAWEAVVGQWSHPDALEGPAAFLEKRSPRWALPDLGESQGD